MPSVVNHFRVSPIHAYVPFVRTNNARAILRLSLAIDYGPQKMHAYVLLDVIQTFRASFYWPVDNSADPEAYNQVADVQYKQHVGEYTASRK